ncbi:MAG: ABC transporter permease [Bacteroidota bacterium]
MSELSKKKKWARRCLRVLVVIAILADFLANDRPIVANYNGEIRWPVFRQYGEMLGLSKPYDDLPGRSWDDAETDFAIWPLVPYAADRPDLNTGRFKPPGSQPRSGTSGATHWLGTDEVGRDVLAGLIRGVRVSLGIGLGSMLIALLLGVLIGAPAGYFADDGLRKKRGHWVGAILGVLTGLAYCLACWLPYTTDWHILARILSSLLLVGASGWLFRTILGLIPLPYFQQVSNVPVDFVVLRFIELITSIPGLVLLIAFLGIIDKPSAWWVILLIGGLRWTGIARFLRAELLRIRQLPYIESARVLGFKDWYILRKHALPNAWGPVIVALSFGIGTAILLEAYLSFLGIGLPREAVSWGSLLRQARSMPSAWWIAIFPGLMIFVTVLACNVLGERESAV